MQVSILGCGWLGLSLAKALINNGYTVNGSTTTEAKLSTLKESGIHPFLVDLENYDALVTETFLHQSEILIINIPPKIKQQAERSYPEKMGQLIPQIKASGIQKVLFVSSTSVFADASPFPEITDNTPPNPDTESGRQLAATEQLLQNNNSFKTTILRFAGLIGENRHPVHHLAGRENIANPDAPVNLIERDDCIGIIFKILQKQAWGTVYNAAMPQHPSRESYYTKRAMALSLPIPRFNHEEAAMGKIIISNKILTDLNYDFKHILL